MMLTQSNYFLLIFRWSTIEENSLRHWRHWNKTQVKNWVKVSQRNLLVKIGPLSVHAATAVMAICWCTLQEEIRCCSLYKEQKAKQFLKLYRLLTFSKEIQNKCLTRYQGNVMIKNDTWRQYTIKSHHHGNVLILQKITYMLVTFGN